MDSHLATMLPPLPSPEQMRLWDQKAIEFGIPENMLMENASRELCAFLQTWFDNSAPLAVCVFMGGGNNGGDAAALARHLRDLGARPVVFHTRPITSLTGACAWHVRLAQADGVPFVEMGAMAAEPAFYLDKCLEFCGMPPAIMVDGLLGTGFHGSLSQDLEKHIYLFNRLADLCSAKVLAIDVPSGLDAMTGLPKPVAIEASATVTLAAAKPGLLLPSAQKWTGQVHVRKIGMPAPANSSWPADTRLLDGRIFLKKQNFAQNSFKNSFGHVLVAAGAGGTSGAARLACAGALRAGAGLVTCCAPADDIYAIKNGWPEVMTKPLGKNALWPARLPEDFFSGITAIVIGPGIGRGMDSEKFLHAVLSHPNRPKAVIDADALVILGRRPDLAALLGSGDILTPHPGEAAAILGCRGADVQADRQGAIFELCKFSAAVAVLKGAGTLIGQKNRAVLLCPYDIPQLAIGGSGDVLAGCAGAMLGCHAINNDSMEVAGKAVAIHAMGGLLLRSKYPDRGAIASELADALAMAPAFIRKLSLSDPPGDRMPWP